MDDEENEMITQSRTQYTPQSSSHNPVSGMIAKSKEVAGDFIELTELQVQLAKADASDFVKKSIPLLAIALTAVVLGMASLPIVLFGLATFVAHWANWELWAAQLVVGAVMLLVAAALLAASLFQLRKSLESFESTTTQLVNNISWIKSIIREP